MTDRAAPARGGARLQQDAEEDLDEDLPPDDGLDRLLGDQDLLMRLQLSGYAQREWMPVAQEFARYGLGVLTPWIGTGRIFAKVRGLTGFRLPPPPDGALDDDAANELASDTVQRNHRPIRQPRDRRTAPPHDRHGDVRWPRRRHGAPQRDQWPVRHGRDSGTSPPHDGDGERLNLRGPVGGP